MLAHTRWWLSLPISAVLPELSQCLPKQDDSWVCPSVQSCQSLPSACPHKMMVESAHQCSLARRWLSLPISAVLPEPSQCLPTQDDGWVCPSVQSSQSLPSACPHKMMVESAHQCSLARAFPVLAHTRWWLSLPISAVLPEPSQSLPSACPHKIMVEVDNSIESCCNRLPEESVIENYLSFFSN